MDVTLGTFYAAILPSLPSSTLRSPVTSPGQAANLQSSGSAVATFPGLLLCANHHSPKDISHVTLYCFLHNCPWRPQQTGLQLLCFASPVPPPSAIQGPELPAASRQASSKQGPGRGPEQTPWTEQVQAEGRSWLAAPRATWDCAQCHPGRHQPGQSTGKCHSPTSAAQAEHLQFGATDPAPLKRPASDESSEGCPCETYYFSAAPGQQGSPNSILVMSGYLNQPRGVTGYPLQESATV